MNKATPEEDCAPAALEQEVQYSQLVKGDALNALKSPPKVVPWTLADFGQEEKQASQQKTDLQNKQVQQMVVSKLAQEREKLRQESFEKAYQEGYEKGFALGKEEGTEVGKSEAYSETREFIFPKLQNLQTLFDDLQAPYQQLESHLFSGLAQFAVHIAEKVILHEVQSKTDWLPLMIEKTILQLPEDSNNAKVEVVLNPDDLEFLGTVVDLHGEEYQDWKLSSDKTLPAGCCRVKQGFSTIHNDWQVRFDKLKQEVMTQSMANISSGDETSVDAAASSENILNEEVPPTEDLKAPSDQAGEAVLQSEANR